MNAIEIEAKVGPNGVLTLEHLPFASGQHVRVRIEAASDTATSPRILGLHLGATWMSDDFDHPLPESFWVGEDAGDESSA